MRPSLMILGALLLVGGCAGEEEPGPYRLVQKGIFYQVEEHRCYRECDWWVVPGSSTLDQHEALVIYNRVVSGLPPLETRVIAEQLP